MSARHQASLHHALEKHTGNAQLEAQAEPAPFVRSHLADRQRGGAISDMLLRVEANMIRRGPKSDEPKWAAPDDRTQEKTRICGRLL